MTVRNERAEEPSEGRVPRKDREARWLRVGAGAYGATLTTFPSSAASEHPLSPVRAPNWEEPKPTDGPTKPLVPPTSREGCRLPEGLDAFHRARPRTLGVGSLPLGFAAASHPRRPHARRRACWTLQASCRARAQARWESERLYNRLFMPGSDDPSMATRPVRGALDSGLIALRATQIGRAHV